MAAFVATADIRPGRFVKQGSTDGTITECDANERIFGISHLETDRAPIPEISTPLAAQAGENCSITHTVGEYTVIELGDTVSNGNLLKSDADGKAVPIASSGTTAQEVGAEALEDGVAGDIIRVRFRPQVLVYPALS